MPRTYFGPYDERNQTYAHAGNANLGRWELGSRLILPDEREYRFALNDGTVEVAGNLYQAIAAVTNHSECVVSTVPAVDDTTIAATLGATAAAVDIYAEGTVHTNKETGLGYAYRIKRAMSAGAAHASAATSSVLTVNLDAGEQVQVAGNASTEVTFVRNRYHSIAIHGSPPTADLAGVSPGVAAASRFYWSQVKGPAAVLASGTLLVGLPVMAGTSTDGAVENAKRNVVPSGTTALVTTNAMAILYLTDQDGTTTGLAMVCTTTRTAAATDVTGGIADNAPIVGICMRVNITAEYALVDLKID